MALINEVAKYIVQADLSQFPCEVIEKAKYCILDSIGCGLYGQEFEATKILFQLAKEWGGQPEASILGTVTKVPSALAAKVNGVAVHVADFDDVSVYFRGHPTAVVLPAALALCEKKSKSGMVLLLAYILGVEVGGKLGKIMGLSHYEAGWHATATLGTIAAAAASARVLELGEEKTCHALAIAASGASGIRENFGTMVKSLHVGQAANRGVMAVLLAERGFEGSRTAFEGKSGFWRVYAGEKEMGTWPDELKEADVVRSITLKRFPSCGGSHPALDALEALMSENPFSWEDVEEITCNVPSVNLSILIHPQPKNSMEAKFSLPYCVSTFLVHGKLELSHFENEAMRDQRVKKLMAKVKMIPDETLDEIIRKKHVLSPTRVCVKLKDREFSKMIMEARGSASNPLSNSEISEKFRICAGRILPEEKTEKALNLISSLESTQDITTLTEILAG